MAGSANHRKLALLIGNNAYARSANRLDHSIENVEKLSDALERIGFHVTRACDLKKYEMTNQIIDFSKTIADGDLVVFYFCGHGCQVNGTNYLIPFRGAWIRTERDVQDFGVNFDRMLRRFVERNRSYANIFILDCCRPYVGKDSSDVTKSKGLYEMKPTDKTFIQFACAASRTARGNLFATHLLRHITKKNINIADLFRRISKDVYEESNRKQRPLSINGLVQCEKIYFNYVLTESEFPPASIWIKVKDGEKESIEKEQKAIKAHYDDFPLIEQVIDPENANIQKAEEFTRALLSEPPSGDVNDKQTVFHVVHQLFKDEGEQCLFFDSTQGVNLYNTFGNLVDRSLEIKPFVLQLHSIDGLGNGADAPDELTAINTLNRVIRENKPHSVTDDIIERLAKAHNVDKKNVVLRCVYHGSINVVYSILQPTVEQIPQELESQIKGTDSVDDLADLPRRLEELFAKYKGVKIHPLSRRPTFDVGLFDERGYKSFEHESGIYDMGPDGRKQQYIQPTGWIRHGWSVLGRYPTDTWLEPFDKVEIWYRAYHGTKNARAKHVGSSDAVNLPLKAAFSIYEHGFDKAENDIHGEGVYCSRKPTFVEKYYAGNALIDTQRGKRSYKIMLQVAVNPDGVDFVNDDIWLVEQSENIRTYGLLIKENGSE